MVWFEGIVFFSVVTLDMPVNQPIAHKNVMNVCT